MKIHLLAFGKLKTPGLKESTAYYLKLIQPWIQIQTQELKPEVLHDKSPETVLQVQKKEAERLETIIDKNFSSRHRVYLLDENAQSFSTLDWAKKVLTWQQDDIQDLVFCVGSSTGFDDEFKKKVCQKGGLLSLGPQTLSHELARVVLMEQLYRALSVTKNHPYHNPYIATRNA